MKTKLMFLTIVLLACSAWNFSNAQYPFTVNQIGFTADVSPSFANTGQVYTWDWGDGSSNGTQFNPPPHVYTTQGTFIITLTVFNGQGQNIGGSSQPLTTTLPAFPFTVNTVGLTGDPVPTFPNVVALDYLWDFGDGTTATNYNPASHTYALADVYNLCLTVSMGGTQISVPNCVLIPVGLLCEPPLFNDFNLAMPNTGTCGDFVGFCVTPANGAAGDYCMDIDWGDGTEASDVSMGMCPMHIYECDGNYTVSVNIQCCNGGPPFNITLTHTITITCPCDASDPDFTVAMVVSGCDVDVSVLFNNGQCADDYCILYGWDVGHWDPATSSQTASHHYESGGSHWVCVNIVCCNNPGVVSSNAWWCQEVDLDCPCEVPTSNILDPFIPHVHSHEDGCGWVSVCLTADEGIDYADLTDYCVDLDWGDGSETESHPVDEVSFQNCKEHRYSCNGTYTITQKVYCCNNPTVFYTQTASVTIDCSCTEVEGPVAFTSSIIDCTVTTTFFGAGSCGNYGLTWDFGDGATGSGSSVTHTYAASGTYLRCLHVYCLNDPSVYTDFCAEVTVVCPCDFFHLNNFPISDVAVAVAPDPLCMAVIGLLTYPEDVDESQYCTRWIWGDGTFDEYPLGDVPNHGYGENGTYTVCVRIFCCANPGLTVLLECQDVTINCQTSLSQCEVFPSFYMHKDVMGEWFLQSTSNVGNGTLADPQQIVITDELMNVEAIMCCIDCCDIVDEVPIPALNPGNYTVTMTTTGTLGNETCTATAVQPLLIEAPNPNTCPSDLDENGTVNISDMLLFLSDFGNVCE